MLVRTSKEGIVFETLVRPVGAVLGDFDIDGSDVKPKHKQWIDANVTDAIKRKSGINGHWEITIIGRTSQSGSPSYNERLSQRRIDSVQDYISKKVSISGIKFTHKAMGESQAAGLYEDAQDRSVQVIAEFKRTGSPWKRRHIKIQIIKPWHPRVDRKFQDFTIEVLAAELEYSLNEFPAIKINKGSGKLKACLKIRERTIDGETAFYVVESKGQIGVNPGLPRFEDIRLPSHVKLKKTFKHAHARPFSTKTKMDAEDFSGVVTIGSDDRLDGGVVKTFRFGPMGFLRPEITIENLTLGANMDIANHVKGESGIMHGKMHLVESPPAWAR